MSTGASSLPPVTRGKAGEAVRPDSSEGETKPEKPPRSQYHGGEREGEGGEGERRKRKKRRSERGSLHEELLEFISQEWASLEIVEVRVVRSTCFYKEETIPYLTGMLMCVCVYVLHAHSHVTWCYLVTQNCISTKTRTQQT